MKKSEIDRCLTAEQNAQKALLESEEKYRLHFMNMDSYNSLYEVVTSTEGKPCKHGGTIDVESTLGNGSTFKVFLPASTESALMESTPSAKNHKGTGTFLVMDDEEVMRDTIGDMLETFGYTVISKANGRDAVDFFMAETKADRKIIGIIFDLTVPRGIGGKAAIEEIRRSNTDTPAFVVSGYADDPVMKNPTEYGFSASICKPFRKSELSEMLNKYMKPQ